MKSYFIVSLLYSSLADYFFIFVIIHDLQSDRFYPRLPLYFQFF